MSVIFLTKIRNLNLVMRKKSDKPKLNDISINYYDFKTVEIIKVRKILRKHYSLKGLKRHDKVNV